MKRNIIFVAIFVLAIPILFQGCVATIVSTSKQKVEINSNPSDAKVYLDDEQIENSPTKVRVKRKNGGEIKIEREGYKTHNEILYPDKINPVAYISMLFLVYPFYVDYATGAAFRLNKNEINVEMIKIPEKIEGSKTICCDEVKFRIKAGEKLGNYYIKDKREEILYFGESLNVDDVVLKQDANDLLKDLGFKVAESKKDLFSSTAQAKYFMKAEVLETKYNVRASNKLEQYAKFETNCEMSVKWELVNTSDEVKFEATTNGKSTKYQMGGTAVFYDAFENSLYSFLYNKEIYKEVEQGDESSDDTTNFSLIRITKPVINVADDKIINNATNSFVTIENGDSHGSGCIISDDGYIVTNYHVVSGINDVLVKFKNGFSLEGNVVRYDVEYDLALIKVSGSGFLPIPISEETKINIGSDIYAVGTPADKSLQQTVTKGIISGVREAGDLKFIQTDVSINPGSSGGGLINKQGFLIGVVNAKLVGKSVEGIGFAIPGYVIFDKLKIAY